MYNKVIIALKPFTVDVKVYSWLINYFLFNFEQLVSDITSYNPSFLLIAGDFNT